MSPKSRKDKKKSPRPPKSNLQSILPPPKPISWTGPRELLERAQEMPLLGCWIDAEWETMRLARVVVARQTEDEQVLYGNYLVDYLCLGIKNCMWKIVSSVSSFHKNLPQIVGTPEEVEPSFAHQLIYGAIAYAERYGFQPHKDFKEAGLILAPENTYPKKHDIVFGENGKPLYIAGPYDNQRQIIATLNETAGEGNFSALIGPGSI